MSGCARPSGSLCVLHSPPSVPAASPPGLGKGSLGAALIAASLVGAGAALAPTPATAAAAPRTFDIPAQPLDRALGAFGVQAGVSVGAGDLSQCSPSARAVRGRYSPAGALARLLEGTGCGFRAVDSQSFSVEARAPAPAVTRQAPAPAAPAALAEEVQLLLDLTVTTTRRPSLVGRTPASITVAPGPSLVAGRITSLQDLAPEFAGVTVTNLGPGRNKTLVRGLSDGAFTGRTQSTVGLYLDDVPVTYNAPDPDLRLVDIERVELMRGPQGSLYGVGSMGGIVRVVTRLPDLDAASAGLTLGGADTYSGATSYAVDALVNAPLVPGRLALRGVAYSELMGGYVDDASLAIRNANRTRRTGGRVAATGLLSPDWQLTIGGTHQSLKTDDSQYVEGGGGRLQRDIRVREPHESRFTQGYVTLDGSPGLGQVRVSAGYLVHDLGTVYDASSGLVVFDLLSTVRSFEQKDRVRLAVAEAVVSSRPGPRVQWLAGVFASRSAETLKFDLRALDGPGPYNLYYEDRRDRLTDAAIYGEVSYALTPQWSLALGARAFRAWLQTESIRGQILVTREFAGKLSDEGISPKAVLSWQPAPSQMFYVQAAQGYRTTGFNTSGRITQQFNADATGNQPNRRYRPDHLWSYELGGNAAFYDRRLQLRAAVFYTDWRDVQSDQFLPSGLPYTANVGRAVNTGFETEASWRVDRALTLRFNLLANSPRLRQRDPTYPARPNASLPAVPRYSAAAVADWRRPVAADMTASLYARIGYVGASILTFQEQVASQMGNYVAARLAASLETSRWRLTAFVDNPANAEGDTFAFGDPFTQGRAPQSTPLRPRTVGLALALGM